MSKLKKVAFQCEVITPMFLAGADQERAEIRAQSIRGSLRYWLRALLGGQGLVQSSDLSAKESQIFGSTDLGSPVTIRVLNISTRTEQAKNLMKDQNSGMAYLWYSTKLGNNRGFIESGSFDVVLQSIGDIEPLKSAIKAFWLLSNFGGLGTRSRRCAGAFQVKKVIHSDIDLDFSFTSNTPDTLSKNLNNLLGGQGLSKRPKFDVLHPSFAGVWYETLNKKTWKSAVEELGCRMKDFRLRKGMNEEHGRDYRTVKKFLQDGRPVPDRIDRAGFGLPLTFRYSSLRGRDNKATINVDHKDYNRRASPLWMTVRKNHQGKFDGILTHFDSQFVPDRVGISIKGRPTNTDSSIIREFIKSEFSNAEKIL